MWILLSLFFFSAQGQLSNSSFSFRCPTYVNDGLISRWQHHLERHIPVLQAGVSTGTFVEHAYVCDINEYTLPVHKIKQNVQKDKWADWAAKNGPHLHFEIHAMNNDFVVCSTTTGLDTLMIPQMFGQATDENSGCRRGINSVGARWSTVIGKLGRRVMQRCGREVFVLHIDDQYIKSVSDRAALFDHTIAILGERNIYPYTDGSIFPSPQNMIDSQKPFLLVASSSSFLFSTSYNSTYVWKHTYKNIDAKAIQDKSAGIDLSSCSRNNEVVFVSEDAQVFSPCGKACTDCPAYDGTQRVGLLTRNEAAQAQACGLVVRSASPSPVQWFNPELSENDNHRLCNRTSKLFVTVNSLRSWTVVSDNSQLPASYKLTCRDPETGRWTLMESNRNDALCYPRSSIEVSQVLESMQKDGRASSIFMIPVTSESDSYMCPYDFMFTRIEYIPAVYYMDMCPDVDNSFVVPVNRSGLPNSLCFEKIRRTGDNNTSSGTETVGSGETIAERLEKLGEHSTLAIVAISSSVIIILSISFCLCMKCRRNLVERAVSVKNKYFGKTNSSFNGRGAKSEFTPLEDTESILPMTDDQNAL